MPTYSNEDLIMRQGSTTTAWLDTSGGNLTLGSQGRDGDLLLKDTSGTTSIHMSGARAQLFLGNNGQDGNLIIRNRRNETTIFLDGDTGDIRLSNGDCAEEFDVAGVEGVDPGTVMVLNDRAELEPSEAAYDSRVAGIVAGAGSYKPGILLDRRDTGKPRLPVALMGKVFVKAETRLGEIAVGDLLTTSDLQGHAMKVTDHSRALGSIIGKAMAPLGIGETGMIPVLVSLQ